MGVGCCGGGRVSGVCEFEAGGVRARVTCPGCGARLEVRLEWDATPTETAGGPMLRIGSADHVCPAVEGSGR